MAGGVALGKAPSGEENIVADLVVCGQTVIAGDIQSTAMDGFMTGLKGET